MHDQHQFCPHDESMSSGLMPLGSGILAGNSSFPSTWPNLMMPNPFFQNHFHPQLGHLDHEPTLCYDTSSGNQRCVALAPNNLPWVMLDVMTS